MSQVGWRELRERAYDYNRYAEILAERNEWQGALEQAHFSVEIAMKAAIAREGNVYTETHDLSVLTKGKIGRNLTIRKAARRHRGTSAIFNTLLSVAAWQMHHRYRQRSAERDNLEDLVEKYGRIYTWIMNTYVNR